MRSRRSTWFRLSEIGQYALLAGAGITVLLPIAFLFWELTRRGLPAMSIEFLTTPPAKFMKAGGILSPLVGTLYLILGTFVLSLPLGLVGAIYLTEYGRGGWFTRVLRLAIVNLAGVPSVVYGLFGAGLFVVILGGKIDQVFHASRLPEPTFGTGGLIWAALTLSLMILPVVITASEEALLSAPDGMRQASLALGATRWQTTQRVVLPAAIPGIATGMILGLSRAAGETAPILLTGAAFFLPSLPDSIHSPFMALPYHLYVLATQAPDVPEKAPWGTALTLLGVVCMLNAAASMVRSRARARIRW